MQSIPDLSFLEFAEVGVQFLKQGLFPGCGQPGRQLTVQPGEVDFLQQLMFQMMGAAMVQLPGLMVFVQQAFQFLQRAVAFGAGQGRGQMIKDHGLGAALGLRTFAGVVDDEGVQVGKRAQGRLGPAGG